MRTNTAAGLFGHRAIGKGSSNHTGHWEAPPVTSLIFSSFPQFAKPHFSIFSIFPADSFEIYVGLLWIDAHSPLAIKTKRCTLKPELEKVCKDIHLQLGLPTNYTFVYIVYIQMCKVGGIRDEVGEWREGPRGDAIFYSRGIGVHGGHVQSNGERTKYCTGRY